MIDPAKKFVRKLYGYHPIIDKSSRPFDLAEMRAS